MTSTTNPQTTAHLSQLLSRDTWNIPSISPFAAEPVVVSTAGGATLALATLATHNQSYYTIVTVSSDIDAGTLTLPVARRGKIVFVDGTALTSTNETTIVGHDAGGGADTLVGLAEVAGDTTNHCMCLCTVSSTASAKGKWLIFAG